MPFLVRIVVVILALALVWVLLAPLVPPPFDLVLKVVLVLALTYELLAAGGQVRHPWPYRRDPYI